MTVPTWLSRAIAAVASLAAVLLGWTLIRRRQTQQQIAEVIQIADRSRSRSQATTTRIQTLEERDNELLNALKIVDDQQAAKERARFSADPAEVRKQLRDRGLTSDR